MRILPLVALLSATIPARATVDEAEEAFQRDTRRVCDAVLANPLLSPRVSVPAYIHDDELDKRSREVRFSWGEDPERPSPQVEASIELPEGRLRYQTVSGEYTRGVFHLYTSPDRRAAPLILMFPITGEQPKYAISRFFCRYFFKKGFRCAYMERDLPAEEDLPETLDGLFQLPGLPPYSVVRARHGLDALEQMGELRPGEKIGVGGISLGAIDAALIASIDERVSAASLMLGGADIPLILTKIHGMGVESFARQREAQTERNRWNEEQFREAMGPRTCVGDPLTYLNDPQLMTNPNLRSGEQVLMINMKGDPAIPDQARDELYRALCELDGKCPDRKLYNTWFLPKSTRHVLGAILHIFGARRASLEHFRRQLLQPPVPAPATAPAAAGLTDNRY